MFILNLIRYLRGTVRFSATGVFVERFLNLAARNHIPIWDGRKRGGIYTGCVSAGDYRRLRAHARKTGVKIRVAHKRGAPFQRQKYRKRNGLLVGLALFAAFLFIMSRIIWRIEVNGNETVADSRIIEALDELGVRPGVLRSSIDVRDIEQRALMSLQELSWVALNIDGSTIRVEVNESVLPPEMIDPNMPCNIVASKSGQILAMNVYEGQALVQRGDTVLEGDIIVSGITQDSFGKNLFKHALADVTAQVQHKITVNIPLHQAKYEETGETRSRGYLRVLGLDLPLFLPRRIPLPYHVERAEAPFAPFSVELPLSYLSEKYVLMEAVPVTYTEQQALSMALAELGLLEKADLEDAEILRRDVSGRLSGAEFILTAEYDCIMEIGLKKGIRQSE